MDSEKFSINDFHDEVGAQLKKIEAIDDITTRKELILQLKTQVEQVSHLLPSYQQLSYSEKIKSLLDKDPSTSSSTSNPKRRYRFTERSIDSRRSGTTQERRTPKVFQEEVALPTITSKFNQVCLLTDPKSLVTQIDRCIILSPDECSSITFNHISNSIIIVQSKGPVFINNTTNCIFFIHCHQLRIHDSSQLRIHAVIPSNRGIIERCTRMIFDGVEQVDDFDHPNGGSDNFVIEKFDEELMKFANGVKESNQYEDVKETLDQGLGFI